MLTFVYVDFQKYFRIIDKTIPSNAIEFPGREKIILISLKIRCDESVDVDYPIDLIQKFADRVQAIIHSEL